MTQDPRFGLPHVCFVPGRGRHSPPLTQYRSVVTAQIPSILCLKKQMAEWGMKDHPIALEGNDY
jgi:hypothetical protein